MSTSTNILEKYHHIIAEEVNVKAVSLMDGDVSVKKTYIPLGSALSSKFGKDTGRIIAAAKAWSVAEQWDTVIVTQWNDSRTLELWDFEVRYEGLDLAYQSAEGNVIVSLDTELDDDLITEWVARELSRFLNQMRKTADYPIDARISCMYHTDSAYLTWVIDQFRDFLSEEALITNWVDTLVLYDVQETFAYEEQTVVFSLKQ
jgi:isoleucyl-tRNA synthetase